MKAIRIIAGKELGDFFNSLIAYIMLIVFLGFSGFFTWLYGRDVFIVGQATMSSFFSIAYWSLFFFIPALTMKLLAEEKSSGTIELLLTKAVTDMQVVIGKFIACLGLIVLALVSTLPYYITILNLGPIDHGAVLCGYLGLLLMSGAYISIGLFASSVTSNQIVAFLLALCIGIFFHIIFGMLAMNFTGIPGAVFDYLSLSTHFESISRGVIDSKDLIYFFSIIIIGIVSSETILARRNLID